jgi:membrane fusion protein
MGLVFRPEVADANRQPWLGPVQLVHPVSLSLLSVGVLVVLLLTVALLFFGEYTRKARVGGVLVPDLGVIRLVPPVAGRVIERNVSEGQAVHAGDVMFVLSLQDSTLPAQAQAQVLRSIEQRRASLHDSSRQLELLVQAQALALDRRLEENRREQEQAEAESGLHRQRLNLAQQALSRLEALRDENFISAAQVQAKREDMIGLQAQAKSLERQSATLARERAALDGERRTLPMTAKGRQGEIDREIASLAREAAEQGAVREIVVRAPQDGTVSAVLADAGQSVSPASALASLVPADARMQAHLFATSGAVGFLKPDQEVRLRFEAFPYQKFGHQNGRVLQVSRTPLAPSELAGLPLSGSVVADNAAEPMFRITVALDYARPEGLREQSLVAGMRLQADVLLERRRLIEWLFEPVLGLSSRL